MVKGKSKNPENVKKINKVQKRKRQRKKYASVNQTSIKKQNQLGGVSKHNEKIKEDDSEKLSNVKK